jgi:hypothetical protein
MKGHCWLVAAFLALAAMAEPVEERSLLELAPRLSELGAGWRTNYTAYLIDPWSHPPETAHQGNPETNPLLAFQRERMAQDGRTGYGWFLYGRDDSVVNGWYALYIQRWTRPRELHNRWVDWKMTLTRVLHDCPPVGEDCFWREDCMFQEFSFRRGVYHVIIEAGVTRDYRSLWEIARVVDAKLRAP